MSVIVVGAGWAGLTTALELNRKGIPVTLLESQKQVGGRGRILSNHNFRIDNGLHSFFGAHESILDIANKLDLHERKVFVRKLFTLDIRSLEGERLRLSIPNVAAPMHLFWALLRCRGLNIHERGTALRFCARLARDNTPVETDKALEQWLLQHGQTRKLIEMVWQPLCLLTLNTPVSVASTRVFIRVMYEAFGREREHSDRLFFNHSLKETLPEIMRKTIQANGGSVVTQCRVDKLSFNEESVSAVETPDQRYTADQVVLAAPPWVSRTLITEAAALAPLQQQLGQFSYNPITTVYLQYPTTVRADSELTGLADSSVQWLLDCAVNGNKGLIAASIHGDRQALELSDDELARQISRELAECFPSWPKPNSHIVIRHKRATFHCPCGIDDLRPSNQTAVKNLWLAGEYTNTGYPSSIESAVRSGIVCAEQIARLY